MKPPIGYKHAQLLMYRHLMAYFPGGTRTPPLIFTLVMGVFALASWWEIALIACVARLWLEYRMGDHWAHLVKIKTQLETHDLTEQDKALSQKPLTSAEKKELDADWSTSDDHFKHHDFKKV